MAASLLKIKVPVEPERTSLPDIIQQNRSDQLSTVLHYTGALKNAELFNLPDLPFISSSVD